MLKKDTWIMLSKIKKRLKNNRIAYYLVHPVTSRIFSIKQQRVEKEHWCKKGLLYPEKKFKVIRASASISGLGHITYEIIEKIYDAVNKGYIPLVTIKDTTTLYLAQDEERRINAWEYYYEQPTMYSLSVIGNARNVVLGATTDKPVLQRHFTYNIFHDEIIRGEAVDICHKYIHISQRIIKKAKKLAPELFNPDNNILGVNVRRHWGSKEEILIRNGISSKEQYLKNIGSFSDYFQNNYAYTLKRVRELTRQSKYDYIYIVSDLKTVVNDFRKEFGEKIIWIDYSENNQTDEDQVDLNDSERILYRKGEEYLIKVYHLSRCDDVFCGINGGSLLAMLLNEGNYNRAEYFNIGFPGDYDAETMLRIYEWIEKGEEAELPIGVKEDNYVIEKHCDHTC